MSYYYNYHTIVYNKTTSYCCKPECPLYVALI